MSQHRRLHFVLVLALMLAGAIAELVTIGAVLPFLAFAANLDSDLAGSAVKNLLGVLHQDPLVAASIVLAAAAIGSALTRFVLLWVSQDFVVKFGQELASIIFSRMIRQDYSNHIRLNSSEVLSGITKVQDVIYGYVQPAMQAIISGFTAFCIAILLFSIDPLATGIGSVTIVLTYLAISAGTSSLVRSNAKTIAEKMTLRTKLLQESLGGIRDIILERSYLMFEEKFADMDRKYRRAIGSNNIVATSPRYLVEAAGISAVVAITVLFSRQSGGFTEAIPVLGALALGAQRLLPLVQSTWSGIKNMAGHSEILNDVAALVNQPVVHHPAVASSKGIFSFQDRLAFEGVFFQYGDEEFALRNLTFEVLRGEHLGIAGPTGAGKSTLLDLILGLLEPDRGKIAIDGRILDASLRTDWQAKVAHVPQSIFLADDTIASNIAFGRASSKIDAERMRWAIHVAQLDAFLEELPKGKDTLVGERGIRLSGGQRQRIGIARALYKRPCVLVLDEATSALDSATEKAVMDAIIALSPDLTIISVAHRASTLALCDRVLTLRDGDIDDAAR